MSKLKLFVSHSSRLDDVDNNGLPLQSNWDLLNDTCQAIGAKYGERVQILVDNQGLIPAQKWNHELNLWLAECHVAIILFSKRAITKSHWVAKEAAILSWRAELDPEFKLIPVMLDGQSTPEDLARDFYGVLKIDENQCTRNANSAADIIDGVVAALGEPEALAGNYPHTPLDKLQGEIAKLLGQDATSASLEAALQAVGSLPPASAGHSRDAKQTADLLARRFLSTDDVQEGTCFNRFQLAVDPLSPRPLRERVEELFHLIRSLWVDAGAAACIPTALISKRLLALSGQYVCLADENLGTESYTLERYLERVWPGSSLYEVVNALQNVWTFTQLNTRHWTPEERLERDLRYYALLDHSDRVSDGPKIGVSSRIVASLPARCAPQSPSGR